MISNKKSYAMKMLQLALALSLLQVDPDNYLYQNLGSWDSQLELRDGDGWELEMLRAVPMVEYPYANRKTMMPLIEDLVRFDRQHSNANQYNVTAYLLNVQSDGGNQTAAAMQELQATSATSATTTATTAASSTSSPGAMALEQATGIVTSNASSIGIGSHDLDVFLNSEHFQDQISVWEQNLADLNDFGELPGLNTYAGLPMKEEPSNNTDFHLDVYLPGLAADLDRLETERAVALNDTFPNPSDTTTIKVEQLTNGTDVGDVGGAQDSDDVATCSASMSSTTASLASSTSTIPEVVVKQEVKTENVPETEELSPFISQVELTKEESEIVEVLWKQDVDLGYTLTPPLLGNASEASGSATGANTKSVASMSDDDAEKLKALEELKHDKLKFDPKDEQLNEDLSDEWAGIPFTIDNETGEYIRLPLDDLFNDVLQLANFVNDDEIDDDSVASTSRAAVNKINSNNNREGTGNNSIKSKVEGDDEEEDDDEEDDDDNNKKANNKVDDDDDNEGEDSNGNNNNNRKSKKNKSKRNNNNNKEKESRPELSDDDLSQSEIDVRSLPSPLFDLDDEAKEELADLEIMIQSAAPPFHHHHHHGHHRPGPGVQNYPVGGGANSAFHRQATGFHHSHHQGRVPLSRGVSMEQRLQDIASLFNPIPSMGVGVGVSEMAPYPHYPSHHYAYQGGASLPAPPPQHAQYPPPHHHHHHHGHHAAMLHANGNVNVNVNGSLGELCPPSQPHYGHNLGSAVSSSMHLTNSSHDGDVGGAGAAGNAGAYKMEHDMMYYSNASSDMNHTTDGFINSILNDEDLHLMDMNVNESFCRMVDVNNSTSNNSSVLGGLSSGHASGGGTTGSSTNGLSMSAAQAAAGGPAPGGMTADLMNAAGATGGDRLDASSDSAVSSMGSERVPSLSDGEWGEGSDSAQDYHQGKYGGPYDYSYSNNNRLNDGSRQPPVAQKKHQMFGKRYLQEQPGLGAAGGNNGATNGPTGANDLLQQQQGPTPGVKYEYDPYPSVGLAQGGGVNNMAEGAMGPAISKEMQPYELKYGPSGLASGYSLDFSLRPPRTPNDIVQHNHTYTMPQGSGSLPRPQQRDKKTSTSSSKSSSKSSTNGDDEHLTRDEKRARALSIPIPVADIINLPMDEFNERLSKYELTENQLSLIRDIRRRGKNKVAAQNCRKRKLDQILTLEDEVKQVRRRKEQLCQDRDSLAAEHKRISTKFATLHRHIFQYLRDPEGNPCSPSEYSLQQATDGSIYLLPRDSNKADGAGPTAGGPSTAPNGGGGNNGGVNGHMSHSQHHPHIAQSHAAHLHAQQQQQQQHQQQHHPHHAQQQATHSLPHHPHAHHTTTTTTQQHPHHPHQKD